MPTNGEANDINTVLLYLLNSRWNGNPIPSEDNAREAAQRLADRSHKTLMAGVTGHDIALRWPGRRGVTED